MDYIAAINEHFSRGLTPENNAAIPFFERVNLPQYGGYAKEIADRLHAATIAAPISRNDGRFATYEEFRARQSKEDPALEQRSAWSNELRALARNPWSAAGHPEAAAWLDAERAPMEALSTVARLPRFFVPLDHRGDASTVRGANIPPVTLFRTVADTFSARAMRSIAERNIETAESDAMTAIRFGYLAGQEPTILERLVGLAIIDDGLHTCMQMTEPGHLSRAQLEKFSAELGSLPPVPAFAECLDVYARYEVLDDFVALSRFGPDVNEGGPHHAAGTFSFGLIPVRFDAAMKEANAWQDRLVAAASEPQFAKREAALLKIAEDAKHATPEMKPGETTSRAALKVLSTINVSDFRREFRPRDFVQQDLNLLIAGLGAADRISTRASDAQTIADWLKTAPGNVFAGGPLAIAISPETVTVWCDPPPSLPASGFMLGGLPLKPAPDTKREFRLVVRIPTP